jgi:hypothetical protein
MAAITITAYNPTTNVLFFNTTDVPTDANVTVQRSIDGGNNWVNLYSFERGTLTQTGFVVFTVPSLFMLFVNSLNVYSNTVTSANTFPSPILNVADRTPIELDTDIAFCNSPIAVRLVTTATSIKVHLWIWNGSQNKVLASPNHVFSKSKVSVSDDYIYLTIDEQIKSFLIAPLNAPNTNQPNFAYNELTNPTITGQGVFYQYITEINGIFTIYRTAFATLGKRYDFEQSVNVPYTILAPIAEHWYNQKIHNYISQSFNLTRTVATATTANVINVADVTPVVGYIRESRDPYLIVYLNKVGLWAMFTPHGKVTLSNKKSMTTNNVNYRDPSRVDNSYFHSKITDNFDIEQSIIINTGSLSEEMVDLVEQIVYSPKIYLIKFKGDLQTTSTVGITIDDTFVTIDDLNITIDSKSVTQESLGVYKTHRQIPVILTDTDFQILNRVNDKNKIDYNLKFEVTTNRILDIR